MQRALAAVCVMWGAPALACELVPGTPSPVPQRMAQCGVVYQATDFIRIGLSKAKDLGHGLVRQDAYESAGCTSTHDPIIMDCNTGRAVVLGSALHDPMLADTPPDPVEQLANRVAKAAAAGQPMTIDAITALAQAVDPAGVVALTTRSRITVGSIRPAGAARPVTQTFGLGCACKTFYPALH
ncbi:hypothetical protein GEU84_003580 [Fertoebacter nigrum]|uniref:Uncharacterized protein n=1 Tax=Fertoeibacter niger TaxID=2656921 RepID=A0A8X8GX38_9RHOB|nr:hypothetical protein [Fertoeibacter niger]NUB43453.1 hypothetical protein [Fertoeibacter niger]